jgi:hypothetical protein
VKSASQCRLRRPGRRNSPGLMERSGAATATSRRSRSDASLNLERDPEPRPDHEVRVDDRAIDREDPCPHTPMYPFEPRLLKEPLSVVPIASCYAWAPQE